MSLSSQLQGSGINQNQVPASSLGGSSANLQSQNSAAVLQSESSSTISVVGEKTEPYQDGSMVNIIILFVIAIVAVGGVVLWFKDQK